MSVTTSLGRLRRDADRLADELSSNEAKILDGQIPEEIARYGRVARQHYDHVRQIVQSLVPSWGADWIENEDLDASRSESLSVSQLEALADAMEESANYFERRDRLTHARGLGRTVLHRVWQAPRAYREAALLHLRLGRFHEAQRAFEGARRVGEPLGEILNVARTNDELAALLDEFNEAGEGMSAPHGDGRASPSRRALFREMTDVAKDIVERLESLAQSGHAPMLGEAGNALVMHAQRLLIADRANARFLAGAVRTLASRENAGPRLVTDAHIERDRLIRDAQHVEEEADNQDRFDAMREERKRNSTRR